MTEMEKNLKDLEELFKLGMLDAEGYAFQKKQLEEEMSRESGQAQAATGSTAPIQQETAPPPDQQTAAPPTPQIPKIHVRVEGREIGAFEREEVIRRIRSGEIRRDARVWKNGMPDWVEAGSLPELETYFDEMKGFYAEEERRKREAEQAAAKAAEPEKLYKEGLECQRCQNWDKGRELLIKAAEMGNLLAQKQIAENYLHGDQNFPSDGEKHHYWWEKAAEQGDPEGCYRVGRKYWTRYTLIKIRGKEHPDYNKTEEFLNKAKEWLNKYLTLDAINGGHLYRSEAEQYLKEIEKKQGKGGGLLGGLFGKK